MKSTTFLCVPILVAVIGVLAISPVTLAAEKKTHAQVARKPDFKVNAEDLKDTIVTPHLEQRMSAGKNVLWCSTFQLAWNELCELTGGAVDMKPSPPMVTILNKKAASKNDLDEGSYVAAAGLATEGIYEKIRKELEAKFKGQASPELLDTTPQMAWVTYAYLFKELPFRWAFTRFHENLRFEGYYVDSFGISQFLDIQKDEVKMASQVAVLHHKHNDDVIIELKTEAKDDRLILAKIPPEESLAATIGMVEKRISKASPSQMRDMEDLLVPVLNFDIVRQYSELCNHPILTANQKLSGTSIKLAAQSIRFRLDERGAILKSEGIAAGGLTPRSLVFDKPFLILLQRHEAKSPYFALWVGNTELLIPAKKKPAER